MKILNWIKNNLTALSISFSNVEKNILGQEKEESNQSTRKERRHLQGTLVDSLIRGEMTQEVKNLRWRTYKILKAAYGSSLVLNGHDENGDPIYTIKKTDNKKLLKKIKLDNIDSYKLEMVFTNENISNSITDVISQFDSSENINLIEYLTKNKTDKPLNIGREEYPSFFIENYTKKINIRRINETEKLLEFYVPKYPDEYNKINNIFIKKLEKLIKSGLTNSDFLSFNSVSFITNNTIGSDDFLLYEYEIICFDKIIEYDGNYVLKFKANNTKSGEDILLNYVEFELEKKYINKEAKKK